MLGGWHCTKCLPIEYLISIVYVFCGVFWFVYLVKNMCHDILRLVSLSSNPVQIQSHRSGKLSESLKMWRVFKDHIYTNFFEGVSRAISVKHWLCNHPNESLVVLILVVNNKKTVTTKCWTILHPNLGVWILRLMHELDWCLIRTCLPQLNRSLHS